MLKEVFEWAFKDGCGMSLAEALSSPRYQSILAEHQLMTNSANDSYEAIAFNAGHLLMGRLFNTFPEQEALQAAKLSGEIVKVNVKERALIEFFGEALIDAAKQCLPKGILTLAEEWKSATAERQIQIAYELWITFRSESQLHDGYYDLPKMVETFIQKRQRDYDGERCILPRLYGVWDKNDCLANCQGKAQMLTAFARLAGARVLAVSPIHHSRSQMNEFMDTARAIIMHDLQQRNLEDADKEFREGLYASMHETWLQAMRIRDFHVSTAIELKDGRWVLIDPHGLVWGVFSDCWHVDALWQKLHQYRLALPGINLIQHDQGESAAYFKQRMDFIVDMLRRSRKSEVKIRSKVENLMDLIRYFVESPDFDLILTQSIGVEDEETRRKILQPQMREMAAMTLAAGGGGGFASIFNLFDNALIFDQEHLENRIKVWLSGYHALALNTLVEKPYERGELLHPVCEFARPEYDLAISALNSLAQYSGLHDHQVNQFFLTHSFDQVDLFNATLCRDYRAGELRQAASQVLQALPFIHPNCRERLGV